MVTLLKSRAWEELVRNQPLLEADTLGTALPPHIQVAFWEQEEPKIGITEPSLWLLLTQMYLALTTS